MHMLPDKRGFVTASADQTVKFWQFELLKFEGQTDSEGKRLSVVHTRTLQLEEDALAVKVCFCFFIDRHNVSQSFRFRGAPTYP